MKIGRYLDRSHIFLDCPLPDKAAVLRFIADVCEQERLVDDAASLYEGLEKREETMSTGAGQGIGFPHTTMPGLRDASVLLIRLEAPIDFEALDGAPVDVIIAIVIPEDQITLHLRILAGVSRLAKNVDFTAAVRESRDRDSLWETIKGLEEKMAFH